MLKKLLVACAIMPCIIAMDRNKQPQGPQKRSVVRRTASTAWHFVARGAAEAGNAVIRPFEERYQNEVVPIQGSISIPAEQKVGGLIAVSKKDLQKQANFMVGKMQEVYGTLRRPVNELIIFASPQMLKSGLDISQLFQGFAGKVKAVEKKDFDHGEHIGLMIATSAPRKHLEALRKIAHSSKPKAAELPKSKL